MKDSDQIIIDKLLEINLRTTDDAKPIFVIAMLSDEEVAQYEQLLQEYKDIFV